MFNFDFGDFMEETFLIVLQGGRVYTSVMNSRTLNPYVDPLPGILTGAIINDESIPEALNNSLLNGMFQSSERFANEGNRLLPPDDLTIKMSFVRANENREALIKGIVERDLGFPVRTLTTYYGPNTPRMIRGAFLRNVRGYDSGTSTISNNPPGLIYPPSTPLSVMFVADDQINSVVQYSIEYSYKDTSNIDRTFTEVIPPDNEGKTIYSVGYYKLDSSGGTTNSPFLAWVYFVGTGTYPELEGSINEYTDKYELYPVIPFYIQKSGVGEPDFDRPVLYQNAKRLSRVLGIDYDSMFASIKEGAADAISKDRGLYSRIILAVNPMEGLSKSQSPTQAEVAESNRLGQYSMCYMIDFLTEMSKEAYYSKRDFVLADAKKFNSMAKQNIIKYSGTGYSSELHFYYIDVVTITGNIGSVGHCTLAYAKNTLAESGDPEVDKRFRDLSSLTYTKQLPDGKCTVVTVVGLKQRLKTISGSSAVVLPDMFFNDENPADILIPLMRPLVKKQNPTNRNVLTHNGVYLTHAAYEHVDMAWYQGAEFTKFVGDTLNAISILSLVGGIATTLMSALAKALSVSAIAKALAIAIIKHYIFIEAFKVVAEWVGAKAAFIISLVLMAYGKVSSKFAIPGAAFAGDMLDAGMYMWTSADFQLKQDLQDVYDDQYKQQSEIAKYQKELERAYGLLDESRPAYDWDAVNYTVPNYDFSQTPDDFYLTKLTPNQGLYALQAPAAFTTIMLQLPSANDSLNPHRTM